MPLPTEYSEPMAYTTKFNNSVPDLKLKSEGAMASSENEDLLNLKEDPT